MAEAGVKLGLDPEVAGRLAAQTLAGRTALYEKWKANFAPDYFTAKSERVKRLADTDGDGRADNSSTELDIDGDAKKDVAKLEDDIDGDGHSNDDSAETDDDGDEVADVKDADDNNNNVKDIDEPDHHPESGEQEIQADLVAQPAAPQDSSVKITLQHYGTGSAKFAVDARDLAVGNYELFVGGIVRGNLVVVQESNKTQGILVFKSAESGSGDCSK